MSFENVDDNDRLTPDACLYFKLTFMTGYPKESFGTLL